VAKWKCKICGWTYDPQQGLSRKNIAAGTEFFDIPESFRCPKCGAKKKWFFEVDE
jgi:rubredoxin